MSFLPSGLSVLTNANGFTLWHYRTTDLRADVLAPGYFTNTGGMLLPGDIVIVQASDATALVPIRGGIIAGGGVTVDATGPAPALLRSASLQIDAALSGTAVPRAIVLDPAPNPLFEGDSIVAGTTVTGPITQVIFYFRTATGTNVATPQTVAVSAGRATATFTAPTPAGGYRLRAVDVADVANFAQSPPFAVAQPPRLLTEGSGLLLLQSGGALLL